MKAQVIASLAAATLFAGMAAAAAPADDARVRALEDDLRTAQSRVAELETLLTTLAADVAALKRPDGSASASRPAVGAAAGSRASKTSALEPHAAAAELTTTFRERILAPDLGEDERGHEVAARPELFLQTGYAADPIDGASADDATTRFTLNRLEARWAGRVAERLGLGFEIQYHAAPDGAPEELVNDAFVEYYASDAVTLRAGQFVKPFGFDVQQSSSVRESPERAIFAGYFFPGQRDRGVLVAADLSRYEGWLDGAAVYAAVLNGNRFFDDDNDALNVNLRFGKSFASRPFAIGASLQTGTQLLPPGIAGSDRAAIYGVDAQWVLGRLGIRAEYARGDMPSTLLSLEPEFAPAFSPGEESWGAAALFDYALTPRDDVYGRADHFHNDPVTRANVRAFNVGYLRRVAANSRVGFDYQWKDDPSFNDDELNTQLTFRWNLSY